jgi:hypothetical protein
MIYQIKWYATENKQIETNRIYLLMFESFLRCDTDTLKTQKDINYNTCPIDKFGIKP